MPEDGRGHDSVTLRDYGALTTGGSAKVLPAHLRKVGRGVAKTVLIVEDNELNMKLFHDLLEAHGYHTVGTRHSIEALDLARKHRPDLIVMDIQLPEVSGLEVTKWLKDDPELHKIPVVAVTAFAMKGDEERIRQGGCEAYLSKPISVGKFLETVRSFLGTAERECGVPPAFPSSTSPTNVTLLEADFAPSRPPFRSVSRRCNPVKARLPYPQTHRSALHRTKHVVITGSAPMPRKRSRAVS